jgi:hypothetical protein
MSGETKSLGQKDLADRFYTKDSVAKQCIDYLNTLIDTTNAHFIEPSAGAGAFLPYLNKYDAFDILPASDNIIKADWLKLDKTKLYSGSHPNIIIGNPPFGVQGNMAIKFFNASKEADYIAFILPKSFRKPSVQNQLDLYFKLIGEIDIPEKSFIFNGKDYDVNCTFQVWKKEEVPREKVKGKIISKYFDFTKDKSKATCSVRRVGASAGKASKNLEYSEQSNYFIINKTSMSDEDFIDFLNSLAHERAENAVGPKSLSKTEFIEDFETFYNGS